VSHFIISLIQCEEKCRFVEDLLIEDYFKKDENCSPHEDSFESRKKQEE
jgi:hypothetical protein